MADGARLESVYTCKRIVGSNPTSSDNNLGSDTCNELIKQFMKVLGFLSFLEIHRIILKCLY